MLEAGHYTQRRPKGSGFLAYDLAGVTYKMTELKQTDMHRLNLVDPPVGFPAFWCALGFDWIGVYPIPRFCLPAYFDGNADDH